MEWNWVVFTTFRENTLGHVVFAFLRREGGGVAPRSEYKIIRLNSSPSFVGILMTFCVTKGINCNHFCKSRKVVVLIIKGIVACIKRLYHVQASRKGVRVIVRSFCAKILYNEFQLGEKYI